MATTSNSRSVLFQLRQLMPERLLLTHEGLALAELQANRLLRVFGINDAKTVPEIVSELPFVRIVERVEAPVAGGTFWLKPHWLIVLNSSDSEARRRFSLFHEFKHILDHPAGAMHYAGSSTTDRTNRAEQAANYFAACALMPKRTVKHLWGIGMQDVSELATQFEVSAEAMQIRLEQLGLVDRWIRPRCLGPAAEIARDRLVA
jgi:Zn-dependent peptidase ImmA (M78 family)